jgi:hypothetical protein
VRHETASRPRHVSGPTFLCLYGTFTTVSRFVLGSSIRVLVFRRIGLVWLDRCKFLLQAPPPSFWPGEEGTWSTAVTTGRRRVAHPLGYAPPARGGWLFREPRKGARGASKMPAAAASCSIIAAASCASETCDPRLCSPVGACEALSKAQQGSSQSSQTCDV